MPMTGPGNVRRCSRAIVWKASSGSATTNWGSARPGAARLTSAPAAPAAAAASRKSWPSRRSDFSATKSWPGCSARVSRLKPRMGPAGGAVQRPRDQSASRPGENAVIPGPPRRSWLLDLLHADELPDHLPVVERNDRVGKFLIRFVALAGDKQAVPGLRRVEREADRPAALVDEGDLAGRDDALLHIRKNPGQRFAARIVGRRPGEVRPLLHGARHQRPLRAVAVAAAAENDQQTAGGDRAEHAQRIAQRVVGVRVIHEDVEGLALLDAFHAARHALEPGQLGQEDAHVMAEGMAGRQRREED